MPSTLTKDAASRTERPESEPAKGKKANRKKRQIPTPTQRLLTGSQIEQEYGIPYRSVYDLYTHNKLPAVRFVDGGRLWFRRRDVEELIERSIERTKTA